MLRSFLPFLFSAFASVFGTVAGGRLQPMADKLLTLPRSGAGRRPRVGRASVRLSAAEDLDHGGGRRPLGRPPAGFNVADALDVYGAESASLLKRSMLAGGFSVDEASEDHKAYVDFASRALSAERRRILAALAEADGRRRRRHGAAGTFSAEDPSAGIQLQQQHTTAAAAETIHASAHADADIHADADAHTLSTDDTNTGTDRGSHRHMSSYGEAAATAVAISVATNYLRLANDHDLKGMLAMYHEAIDFYGVKGKAAAERAQADFFARYGPQLQYSWGDIMRSCSDDKKVVSGGSSSSNWVCVEFAFVRNWAETNEDGEGNQEGKRWDSAAHGKVERLYVDKQSGLITRIAVEDGSITTRTL